MSRFTSNIRALDEVTTGTTSGIIDVSMAKKLSIQCVDTLSVTGTVAFTVQVSNDGEFFTTYNRFTTNAAAGVSPRTTLPYTDTLTLSSTVTSGIMFFPPDDYFRCLKVKATKSNKSTTSLGTLSAIVQRID
jgi:hypothetical protein